MKYNKTLLFLENRDRVYDKNIYRFRGHYNVQNLDFDLSQFDDGTSMWIIPLGFSHFMAFKIESEGL